MKHTCVLLLVLLATGIARGQAAPKKAAAAAPTTQAAAFVASKPVPYSKDFKNYEDFAAALVMWAIQPAKPDNPPPPIAVQPVTVTRDNWDRAYIVGTLLIALTSIILAGIAVYQARVTRAALIATNRPKVEVKWVSVIPGKFIEVNGKLELQDDIQWQVACVIANVGGSRARVEDSNVTVSRLGVGTLHELLSNLPAYGKDYSFGKFFIEPGERQERVVVLKQNPETMNLRALRSMAQKGTITSTSPLVVFGFFHYRDDSGVGRRTGFGAQWNPIDLNTVLLQGHPEYNYAD